MRLLFSFAIASMIVAPATYAAKPAMVSWGKIGVSFDQYRQDAVECGTAVYHLDVSDTEAAQVFKKATSQLDNNETNLSSGTSDWMKIVTTSAQIVQGTRPETRLQEVRDYQYEALSICLSDRGYKRFALTGEQMGHLNHLKKGSPERHQYLYELSVNPKVLEAQAAAS